MTAKQKTNCLTHLSGNACLAVNLYVLFAAEEKFWLLYWLPFLTVLVFMWHQIICQLPLDAMHGE